MFAMRQRTYKHGGFEYALGGGGEVYAGIVRWSDLQTIEQHGHFVTWCSVEGTLGEMAQSQYQDQAQ